MLVQFVHSTSAAILAAVIILIDVMISDHLDTDMLVVITCVNELLDVQTGSLSWRL
jgi:hypothetical protein